MGALRGEAAAFLAWNQKEKSVEVIVPKQVTMVSRSRYGDVCPVGVRYEVPTDLPRHVTIFVIFTAIVIWLPTLPKALHYSELVFDLAEGLMCPLPRLGPDEDFT